uniref:Serine/threonine-protein kinase ULK3 n=1 Tax=Lygus hesperus TaxID=30085 RepID=A0A0A9XX97_LYGHE
MTKHEYIIEKILSKGLNNDVYLCYVALHHNLTKDRIVTRSVNDDDTKPISTGELVVVKVLKVPPTLDDKDSNASSTFTKLLSETKISNICSSTNHPNIVEYLNSFITDDGNIAIVFSYCNSGDLRTYLHTLSALRKKIE